MKTVYIGNLARSVTDRQLTKLFSPFGTVNWASIVRDKLGNVSQGFAFVEMDSCEHAAKAIIGLNGLLVRGKYLKLDQAKCRHHVTS